MMHIRGSCLTLLFVMTLHGAFGDLCPNISCRCVSYNLGELHITCDEEPLTEIPTFEGLPSFDFVALDMQGNDLTSIPANSFPFITNLTEADFSSNNISKIDETAFSNLPRLAFLAINNNQLTSESLVAFKNLTTLQSLYMDNNQLRSIPDGAFYQLTELFDLSLQGNGIQTIGADALPAAGNDLFRLYLSNNKLGEDIVEALQAMYSLYRLDLGYNNLQTIPANAFSHMSQLIELHLNNNSIKSVDDNAFPSTHRIGILDLGVNKITSNSLTAFENVLFEYLFLQDNSLTTVPEGIFSGPQNVAKVNLKGNPIDCNSTICWMKNSDWISKIDDWTCAAPPELAGKVYKEADVRSCPKSGTISPIRITRFHIYLMLVAVAAAIGF